MINLRIIILARRIAQRGRRVSDEEIPGKSIKIKNPELFLMGR
jgi:hypothetical protein